MKLISMTQFVLQQKQKFVELGKENYDNSCVVKSFELIINYAEFLSQPLTLGMVVPVDEVGDVLEKIPVHRFADSPEKYRKYKGALEKVLFEGFEVIKSDIETLNHTFFLENNKGEQVGHKKSWQNEWDLYGISIEDLIGFDLELTPSVLKQIGIES